MRDPWDTWEKGGRRTAIDNARAKALDILQRHQPRQLDAALTAELDGFRRAVAARSLDEFYSYEDPARQDLEAL